MSFETKYLKSVVIAAAGSADFELIKEEPNESASGFDSIALKYLIRDSARESAREVTDFSRGSKVPGLNMWVTARQPRQVAHGVFTLAVTAQGILSDRGLRVSYSAAPNNQTGENILVAGVFQRKLGTVESAPTIEVEDIFLGDIKPTIDGVVTTPPPASVLPPDPSTVWDFLIDPTFNFPNGWIMRQSAQGLPGVSGVWLRKRQWQWIHRYQP